LIKASSASNSSTDLVFGTFCSFSYLKAHHENGEVSLAPFDPGTYPGKSG